MAFEKWSTSLSVVGIPMPPYGNAQHGDFQPSNIFWDEESGQLALIDVGGMGIPTTESDVDHFSKAMRLPAESYGMQFAADAVRHFQQGYAEGRRQWSAQK